MSNEVYRRVLLTCGVLLALVALLVALVIVPAVESDVSPNARPEKAVLAFWVNVGLNLILAIACGGVAFVAKFQGSVSVAILVVIAIVGLLLGLALVDAAFAFRSHELIMPGTPALLFICAAVDLIAGVVVILAVARRPRIV